MLNAVQTGDNNVLFQSNFNTRDQIRMKAESGRWDNNNVCVGFGVSLGFLCCHTATECLKQGDR